MSTRPKFSKNFLVAVLRAKPLNVAGMPELLINRVAPLAPDIPPRKPAIHKGAGNLVKEGEEEFKPLIPDLRPDDLTPDIPQPELFGIKRPRPEKPKRAPRPKKSKSWKK